MIQKHPKVLISTVDCWNDKIGANTMSSLFDDYNVEKIANIYIRADIPNSQVCERYFQISENNVMKSIFKRNTITGRVFSGKDENLDEEVIKNKNKEKSVYTFFKKYRLWIFLFAREIIWKAGRWKSKELNEFVDDFNPDVLFFPVEGYIHFNRLNEYLIKKSRKKAICFIWDDVFTYKTSKNIGFLIHRYFCRRSIKQLISLCDAVFAITPKAKKEIDREFNINSILLTKPINYSNSKYYQYRISKPIQMIYTGNLLIDRDKTLIKLVDTIKKINSEKTIPYVELNIYTSTKLSEYSYSRLNVDGSCYVKKAVTQNQVFEIQKQADILVFAEALEGNNKYSARLSFSTKLTDYFATGKCIFAIGPKDIAPIEYLIENNCAIVAINEKEIYVKLKQIINNENLINEYGFNSYNVGQKKHNEVEIKKKLYEVINKVQGINNID